MFDVVRHRPASPRRSTEKRSGRWVAVVAMAALAAAAVYMATGRGDQLPALLPWALVLACPLLHLFAHRGRRHRDNAPDLDTSRRPGASPVKETTMHTHSLVATFAALALGLSLTIAGPARAQDTATDPHHPETGAASSEPAAAAEGAQAEATTPAAPSMPQDLMAMCPMMGTMMQQMMAAMMGQGMMGQGMMGQGMMGQGMGQQVAAADSPAVAAYKKAHEAMMTGMMQPLSGDADRDFATQMIPHHQGAIDMAKVELAHGKDPQLRKMAEAIIAAQEKEIAELQAWLAGRPEGSQ
jgi:uncharacterized protein (DUF305 family)